MKAGWRSIPLSTVVKSKQGNNSLIKGKHSDSPRPGLVQGYSASGPDVWVPKADHHGPGVVISAVGARCGRTFIAEGDWTAIANTHVLLPTPEIDPRWLWYRTNDQDFWIRGGSAQPFVKTRETLNRDCTIPPLPEQQRIVGKLDAAFAALTEAQDNVERNRANARELFESYLKQSFDERGQEWKMLLLQEIAHEFGRGKSKHRPRGDVRLLGGEYPFIQTGDISNADQYITTYTQTYNKVGLAQSKLWPKGTVCMAIVGVGSADTAILSFESCFPDSVIGIVVDDGKAHNEYVQYLLEYFKAELKEKGKGTARDNMNLGMFQEHSFPFPSRKRQEEIAQRLNAIRKESSQLETTYQEKLSELEGLKKGLLGAAFRGEL